MPDDLCLQIAPTTIEQDNDAVDRPLDGYESDGDAGRVGGTERLVIAGKIEHASTEIVRLVVEALERAAKEAASGASTAELERTVAKQVVSIGQRMVALAFATSCRAAMDKDLRERGLTREQVRLRTDEDGYITVSTTFGPITFPTFTYRDLSSPLGSVIRRPAHRVFPYHQACRSSPLCLEWEARLGAQHPYRKAEELLRFFTRGASTVEDTSISRHMLALSSMVKPSWLYETPERIREILATKATRDKTTSRPLLYVSSDAHALRRYVDASWITQWKMTNGIRLWCEDAETGEIIHLGGEFTWGDCRAVAERFNSLISAGTLPNGDDAWKQLNAQVVFVSDGSDWLTDHVIPLLADAVIILDPYHLLEWFGVFTKLVFGLTVNAARDFHARLRGLLFGKKPKARPRIPTRRGHKKQRRKRRRHAYDGRWLRPGRPRTVSSDVTTKALLDLLGTVVLNEPEHIKARDALVERLAKNALRTDYATHLARGMQIGSGPMESMHRSGSQLRLKLPGARWLEETSQAVLQFRMLELSGRWNEFWNQNDLTAGIATAFATATVKHRRAATA